MHPKAAPFFCISGPRQGRLEEARQSLAWLREGEHFLEEEEEILEVARELHRDPHYTLILSLKFI